MTTNKAVARPHRETDINTERLGLYQERKSQQAQSNTDSVVSIDTPELQIQKPKKLPQLDSATNKVSQVFVTGDKIMVSAPWGGTAAAEIVMFYQADGVWAKYKPLEVREGWTWESGCLRASRLTFG